MAQIVELKSSDGSKLYPITKTTAVYNDDGKDVETLLATRDNDISVLSARMDQYESIQDGSTTGDAELMDVRIAFDGSTYDSAGTAVRTQIGDLNQIMLTLTREMAEKIDGAYVEDGYLYMTSNGVEVVGPLGPFSGGGGGGGGGSDNNAILALSNASGWLAKTISQGSSCPISFNWSSLEDETPTGPGVMTITINSVQKANVGINQGTVTFDVGPYMATGLNNVRVKVTDSYGNIKYLNFTVTSVLLTLTSSFDTSTPYNGSFQFSYVPTGDVLKTVHFILDGIEIGTQEITASGRQQSYIIPTRPHGDHSLSCYFEATVDGEIVKSNTLFYEYMSIEDGNDTPIITTSFTGLGVTQYATVPISYRVYTPAAYDSEVFIYANDELLTTLTVDRTEQVYSYHAGTSGTIQFKIVSGITEKIIPFTVSKLDIDVKAETEALSLYLSAQGRSNREANPRTWVYNDIEAVFSDFNMTSDGWQTDNDGVTVLRVTGDARLTIPYKPFANDFRFTGKTIEIEFATRDILNYDSNIISCMDDNRGFSLTAQKAVLRSEQSEIYTQYKEDEHVRIAFVVEKQTEHRLVYIYINGIMSGVIQYPENDDFSQITPLDISIGSNDCTIDIYCIRVYDNDLTRFQVVDNWIADTGNGELMFNRYTRNNVFDTYGNIIIANLPQDLPYLVMTATELPQSKGDKKTISGTFTNPSDPDYSFTFEGAQADVQGTSSQYYPRKNYKVKFKGGFTVNGEFTEDYAMNEDAIPTNTFTFKADFASSEGANNVELVRLYNEACPYKTPPQKKDPKVRQGIDGFPMVVFWNNGNTTAFVGKYNFNNDKGTEEVFGFVDGDESWEIKNNTSDRVIWKSDDYTSKKVVDGKVVPEWLDDFEGRFPDGNEDPTNLSALARWLKSTDTDAATGVAFDTPIDFGEKKQIISYDDDGNMVVTYEPITHDRDDASYRLAKFKKELPDYMEVDAVIFYYLFTELFLMVDSRAKNAFPTFMGGDKWMSLPYDMDTAIGINNEGALVFGYELEDIDHTESGADVYNGQNSVLWVNLRNAYYDEIASMYQTLRSEGALSYAKVEKMFEDHQSKWPETLFNEDSYFKYIQPFIEKGENYLDMLQGSKEEQRKWWLYNRFRYIDSKYNAGDALTDVITVRGYAKDNITVIPYADIYPTVKYGSYLVHERGKRNTKTTLVCPLDRVNDTEIYIYSASQLASVGDLSGLKPGLINISSATRLQELKVGDASSSYSNGNLTSLTMGNNVLLKKVDVRNCPSLTTSIDMRGCTNIEEVYFEGTNITSVNLPNGGVLKVLHLPGSITNLTIMNQTVIREFVLSSYDNLATIRLENVSSVIDPITILHNIKAGSRVRIIGFHIDVDSVAEIEDFCEYLDTMRGLDENGQNVDTAQVQGTIHVPFITGEVLGRFKRNYPNIVITYDHIESKIYYYNYDGSILYYTETVNDEGDGTYAETFQRESTAQYHFTFGGWSLEKDADPDENAVKKITIERIVYAAYIKDLRSYTVTWVNKDGTELEVDAGVYYGTMPKYDGETPTYAGRYANGWEPEVSTVTGDITYTAMYLPVYMVWFYNGSILLQTVEVVMHQDAVYTGETPVDPTGEGMEWLGWATTYGTHTPEPDAGKDVIRNMYLYAVFKANYEYPTSHDVSNAYGVEWNYTIGTLKLTRTGLAANFNDPAPPTELDKTGTSPFDTVMPWAGMKRYNVIDGAIKYTEDDPSFDQNTYDTVVYIPEFYYTAQKDILNGKWIWAISPTPKNGYVKHPGSGRYIGRFHSSGDNEVLYSKGGVMPRIRTSLNTFRTLSHDKGDNWYIVDLATWSAVQMLYLIEYANFDSQLMLGTGYAGITSAVAEMGDTNTAVYHTLKASETHNMYRWIEDPFSNCRTLLDGFLGNRSICYVGASNKGYTGQIDGLNAIGFGLPSSGYIAGFGYSEAAAWAFIPDTAYTDDTVESTIDYVSSAVARCPVFVGGDFDAYEAYGFFFFYASTGSNASFPNLGSRLIFIE